jgi:hypothetical protein
MQVSQTEMFNLFLPYYRAEDPSRQSEINYCLAKNIENTHIKNLIVLIDDDLELPYFDNKIQIVRLKNRPTYKDWLEITTKNKLDGYSVLANSDIYFDDTIQLMRKCFASSNTLVTLSRWEKKKDEIKLHPKPMWSQDVWAVACNQDLAEISKNLKDISLGIPRCDNKLAYIFGINGWEIKNPCHFVKSYHVHDTELRNYNKKLDDRIIGGVAYVNPSSSLEKTSKLELDVWVKNQAEFSNIKINQCLGRWEKEAVETATLNQTRKKELSHSDSEAVLHLKDIMEKGQVVYQHLKRFQLVKFKNYICYIDGLNISNSIIKPLDLNSSFSEEEISHKHLREWIRPTIDITPIKNKNSASSKSDVQFWQYPCATEKQAFENHLALEVGDNFDVENKIIHTYLPIPWATYIDKKSVPEKVIRILRAKIMGLKSLSEANGYELKVHTVCQHIHWQRILSYLGKIFVTDLHISHMETDSQSKIDSANDITVHSWPLIAVNVEDPSRSDELVFGKDPREKKYLATFIGAHMPHYRSEIRLELLNAARKDGGDDILYELGGEWHFNKIVYDKQVNGKDVTQIDQVENKNKTSRYNKILSDSIFSLCPEGAGPNTLRFWEALAVGSIPVLIADNWEIPRLHGSDKQLSDCCVIAHSSEVEGLLKRLRSIEIDKIEEMQAACMHIYEASKNFKVYHNSKQ